MQIHHVKVHPSSAQLPREEQLAWKIAGVAADNVPVESGVAEAIIDRVIDDASVAIAAINRSSRSRCWMSWNASTPIASNRSHPTCKFIM